MFGGLTTYLCRAQTLRPQSLHCNRVSFLLAIHRIQLFLMEVDGSAKALGAENSARVAAFFILLFLIEKTQIYIYSRFCLV